VFKNINCVFFAKKAIKNNFLKHLARPRPSKPDKSQRQSNNISKHQQQQQPLQQQQQTSAPMYNNNNNNNN